MINKKNLNLNTIALQKVMKSNHYVQATIYEMALLKCVTEFRPNWVSCMQKLLSNPHAWDCKAQLIES
jgi:hypothetical protein